MKMHFTKKFKNKDFKLACIVKFLLELDKPLHKLAKNIKFIKCMNEYTKLACIVKLNKFLHKLAKNTKFNKSNKTLEILHVKSNMRLTTLLTKSDTSLTIINNMDVIIPYPNTMKSNAMASSSSPCPSSTEATIPKSTFHGH